MGNQIKGLTDVFKKCFREEAIHDVEWLRDRSHDSNEAEVVLNWTYIESEPSIWCFLSLARGKVQNVELFNVCIDANTFLKYNEYDKKTLEYEIETFLNKTL